jgi:hypothetical protein
LSLTFYLRLDITSKVNEPGPILIGATSFI